MTLFFKARPVEGRYASCQYINICGGNSRTRAWSLSGNFWAEDPGCYLENSEIGVDDNQDRLQVTLWSRKTAKTVVSPKLSVPEC